MYRGHHNFGSLIAIVSTRLWLKLSNVPSWSNMVTFNFKSRSQLVAISKFTFPFFERGFEGIKFIESSYSFFYSNIILTNFCISYIVGSEFYVLNKKHRFYVENDIAMYSGKVEKIHLKCLFHVIRWVTYVFIK